MGRSSLAKEKGKELIGWTKPQLVQTRLECKHVDPNVSYVSRNPTIGIGNRKPASALERRQLSGGTVLHPTFDPKATVFTTKP